MPLDFPSGPTDGQIFNAAGVSWMWDGTKWTSVLSAGGPFLPLAGGDMSGPLNYVATGGTTKRSAQDRAADVANALDFGADPTGVLDSSIAINAAAAQTGTGGRHKAVYLPTGLYRVNKQINLTATQALYGDSRGSSVLLIDQAFDPAAAAVIMCTSSYYDPGPVIRDLGIYFVQPQDQSSRANFKTLAAGGTSGPGGSGVKYPWAISSSGPSPCRIQVMRVRISGAWDGITSNGWNTVFWLEDIEMGALDCGISLGEGAQGIMDFCHISGYHFWNFDLGGSLYPAVFADGQAIALRVGRVDGLDIRDFSSFCGRLIVTPDAAGFCSIHITNCMMDTDHATIEINGDMLHFNIANLSGSASTVRSRPFVSVAAACHLHISNLYSHSSANFPDLVLTNDAAEVTVSNFNALFYTNNISWAQVQRGRLRLVDGQLFTPGPRTVALIAETVAGYLSVDNVAVQATNASGPLIAMVTAGAYSIPGRIATQAGNTWTYTLPGALTQTFFSPVTTFQNGAVFANLFQAGRVVVAGPSGAQNGMVIYRGATIGWTMQSTGVADDFFIGRWNDAGALVDNPIGINRATGAVTIPSLSAAAGSFSTLSASTTVSGAGFTSYMAAPPAIGGTTAAAGTFTNLTAASGIKFSGTPSAGYDTSKHVNLDGAGTAGLNLQGGVVNMVVPTGSNLTFYIGTGTNGFIDSTGLNFMPVGQTGAVAGAFSTVALNSKTGPTIRAGTGAATGTQPSGSLWLRTDGTTANRLYVTSGGGTWLAVAGV